MTQLDAASAELLSGLATSAARSFALAGIAATAVTVFGFRSCSLRLLVWNSVVYACLALPLLGWLLPPLEAPLPEFPHTAADQTGTSEIASRFGTTELSVRRASRSEAPILIMDGTTAVPARVVGGTLGREVDGANTVASWMLLHWTLIATVVYLLGTSFLLLRLFAGTMLSRRLLRKARMVAELSQAGGTSFPHSTASARVAVSELISVPVTVGILRPAILLPAGWDHWDDEKLQAVLAHERSHVLRRDPLTQCVSLLYRAFFWFSPLSWWLHQHVVMLAEQASDEAALSRGVDQTHYARTLLSFVETLRNSPGRVRWQGVSMARPGQAEQRVERILAWKGTVAMNLKRSFVVAIIVLAIPVVLVVAAVRPVGRASAQTTVLYQATPPVPALAPTRGVTGPGPAAAVASSSPVTAAAPVGPTAGVPPVPAIAPVAPGHFGQHQSFGERSSYSYGFDDEERFVITSGKSDSYTMSGSTQDIRHVEKLKKQIPGEFIWFQRDEESYIIRDQATIKRARELFAPQEELGKQQEELGKQQEELGKQQEELSKKMEQVRINVPDMTAELDRLKAKLQKLGPTATMEQIGDLQSEIGELQSKIGDLQGHAGEEQGKLGELQGELGEKQGKLGEQQGALGEKQGELAEKATKEMRGLLDEAIKNGTAKPERDIVKGSGSL